MLARCIDFLAKYDFRVIYCPGAENAAAEFLLREACEEAALGTVEHDCQIALVTLFSSFYFEPFLAEVKRHLCGEKVQEEGPKLRRRIRRASNSFLIWNDELFRRTPLGLKIVLPKSLRP